MEVSGQLQAPAALISGTHWIGEWVGPIAGMDAVEKKRILPLPGIEPQPPCQ
jgi:hypothetical protein